MAVDRGYGSGKPRSAANSSMRRRVAAGQTPKSKKGNAALKKIAAENPVTGFIGGGILPAKLIKAASSLVATGQVAKAAAVKARLAARIEGRTLSGNVNDVRMRNQSTSVFPRIGGTAKQTQTLRQEYLAAKQGYEQVFGRGSKMGSFNPDIAAMTSYPGRGATTAKIRKISNQVDAYLAKRGRKGLGR